MDTINELLVENKQHSNKNFVHLHAHNNYSFLDGFGSAEEHVKRAQELGMTSLATTNHNHLGGVIDFKKACEKYNITPILGYEGYWTKDTSILSMSKQDRDLWAIKQAELDGVTIPTHTISSKGKKKKITKTELKEYISPYEYDTKQYHILFLAINQTGWSNLSRLQSEASTQCTFNGRYLVDDKLLEKYNEGIIMTTACIGSVVANLINDNKIKEAEDQIDKWHSIFKDRFYLEIQPLNIAKQRVVNLQYIEWSKEKNIKIIATNDVHYPKKEDHDDHDTLLCIGTGKKKIEEKRMRYSNDFWLRSYSEMLESFTEQAYTMLQEFGSDIFNIEEYMHIVEQSLDNTNLIADMIKDIKLGSDIDLFPKITIPYNNMTKEEYLTMICFQNLYAYKRNDSSIDLYVYSKRLNEELNIINKKGFAPYILVVQEYIEWANKNGCPTGPGRGSGAGSLVLFLLGITKMIDPIKNNLLFFRFLTFDRTSPPDWEQIA